jgi:uncharacterized cupredoxin-like copper-binding protein
MCTIETALAAGYLGARAENLEPLRIGIGDDGYGMAPKAYRVETGKGYRLSVHSTGTIECELDMREFLDNVWVRQVKAGDVEFLNPVFSVVELDDEGEFELTFVPIRPGEYEFACEGLEDRGLAGTIVVE